MKNTTKHILSFALLLTIFGLPLMAGAQFNADAERSTTGLANTDLITVLANIIKILLSIVAVLAVLGFVVAGILFITAGGNDNIIGKAKSFLTFSVVGVIVSLIGYIVVKFVSSMFTAS